MQKGRQVRESTKGDRTRRCTEGKGKVRRGGREELVGEVRRGEGR